jgi:hypothetical protein
VRDYHFRTKVSFRFLELTELQSKRLSKVIESAKTHAHYEKLCFVGSIELTKLSLLEIISFYSREKIDIDTCDIFVSICSESDSEIWEVPFLVNEMLKQINCKLTYSFTCVA